MKRIISMLTAVIMLIGCFGMVYAAEGVSVENGFAVVSNEDVMLHNTMTIEGDVFSNESVILDNAGLNVIDGDVINAGTFVIPEYSPENPTGTVTDNAAVRTLNYDIVAEKCDAAAGDITIFDKVEYVNEYEWITVAGWGEEEFRDGMTISENTYFKGGVTVHKPITIDTSNGDVYVKIDSLVLNNTAEVEYNNGYFEVVGDNKAYIYLVPGFQGVYPIINSSVTYDADGDRVVEFGDSSKVDLYIDAMNESVSVNDLSVIAANIYICNAVDASVGGMIQGDVVSDNTGLFDISGSGLTAVVGNLYAKNASEVIVFNDVIGNLVSGAPKLTITAGGSDITGIVYVPNADVYIGATSVTGIHGQLVAKSLDVWGTGTIIYGEGLAEKFYEGTDGVFVGEVSEEEVTPTEEPIPELTTSQVLVKDTIYYASDLNKGVKTFAEAWDVTNESFAADYEAMGETFGSLDSFENYTEYLNSDAVATVVVPADGDYVFSFMLREYKDRGFDIKLINNETGETVTATTVNNITKVAKSGEMNMGVSQNTVTLKEGTYTMVVTKNAGSHLCGFKFEDANAVEEVVPTETPATEEPEEPTERPYLEILIPNDTPVLSGGPITLTCDYRYLYGYSDTVSGVDQPLTRQELCALVNRVLLQNDARDGFTKPSYASFDDLDVDWWSHSALEYMTSIGVYNNSEESPNVIPGQNATRWEVAKVISVALGLEPTDDDSNFNFSDEDNYYCQTYYKYLKAMVDYGYYTGHGDGTIAAQAPMTRAEFVTMFNRIIGRTPENGYTIEKLNNAVGDPNMYIDDLDSNHWAYLDILNASYSFTDGEVDLEKSMDRTTVDYQ